MQRTVMILVFFVSQTCHAQSKAIKDQSWRCKKYKAGDLIYAHREKGIDEGKILFIDKCRADLVLIDEKHQTESVNLNSRDIEPHPYNLEIKSKEKKKSPWEETDGGKIIVIPLPGDEDLSI